MKRLSRKIVDGKDYGNYAVRFDTNHNRIYQEVEVSFKVLDFCQNTGSLTLQNTVKTSLIELLVPVRAPLATCRR